MFRHFETHLKKHFNLRPNDRLLLAISGGIDSVVLAHLLKKCGLSFALAHCNFKLRGRHSEGDEKFCRRLAKKLNAGFYSRSFDVNSHCKESGQSIQMAARELRYTWFLELLVREKFDYLLTAHHANDLAETMLLNLIRGTGIKGMKGIQSKSGFVLRPLLPYKKEELLSFAKKEKLVYREDHSNQETRYERNFIRLKIIPLLKELNPSLEETFARNAGRMREEAGIVSDFLEGLYSKMVTKKDGILKIDRAAVSGEKYAYSLLLHILVPYGFNETQVRNLVDSLKSNESTGKLFFSAGHQLTVDRKNLVLRPAPEMEGAEVLVNSMEELKRQPFLRVSELRSLGDPDKKDLVIKSEKLKFPLVFRSWKKGDRFKPFGMRGFKLLSDFLKEQRLNAFEKEACRLMVNGNGEIVWVVGYRSDERYRVLPGDRQLIKLSPVG